MAQQAFNLYKKQFGYPPKHEKHLQAFGKLNGIKLKYSECKDIIKNNKNVTSISKKPSNSTQKIHNNPKKTKINQKKKLRKNLFFAKKPGLIKKSRLNLVKPHNKKKNDNLPAIKPTKTPASALSQSTTVTQTTSASSSASASAPIQTQSASLHFIYKGNVTINNKKFDKNGLIYYMGTKCNTTSYRNPVEMNLVKCSQSKITCTQTKYLLQNYDKSNYISLRGYNEYNQHGWQLVKWIRIDLQNDIKLAINGYTLTNFTGIDWDFEASNDGKHWIVISKKRKYKGYLNKNDINCNYFMINNQSMFKHFRIKEFSAKSVIECGGIELYGDCFVDVNIRINPDYKYLGNKLIKFKPKDVNNFLRTSVNKKQNILKISSLKMYKDADQLTKKILSQSANNLNDRDCLLSILGNIAKQNGKHYVFYDSKKMDLKTPATAVDINKKKELKFTLTLHHFEDEYNVNVKDEINMIMTLQQVINNKQDHYILNNYKERLSKIHKVSVDKIKVTDVFYGTINVTYVVDVPPAEMERYYKENAAGELEDDYKRKFSQYKDCKIHALLLRDSFDINMFDANGNKTFATGETFQVGPVGHEQTYTQPQGWVRFGLKVLNGGKYGSDDPRWLHPFQDPNNWYRCYHGTGSSNDTKGKSVDVMSLIHNGDFHYANEKAYGPGVYCSCDPVWLESNYAGTHYLNGKTYKFMLQCAVNPYGVRIYQDPLCGSGWINGKPWGPIWVANTPHDLRAYAILIKEC